jgi:hypothetical protein
MHEEVFPSRMSVGGTPNPCFTSRNTIRYTSLRGSDLWLAITMVWIFAVLISRILEWESESRLLINYGRRF